jgi:hypothetical protein
VETILEEPQTLDNAEPQEMLERLVMPVIQETLGNHHLD